MFDASEYEVIVTDDGSRTTAELMLRERFPWARWIAGPCRGPAANRNNGARVARGDWLAFTDDDCLPEPNWLAGFNEAAAQGAQVLEGKTICSQGIRSTLDEAPVNLTGGLFPSCNLMIRRDAFQRIGRFDEDFCFWCEDQYFNTLARRTGNVPRFVPDAVVDHPRRRRPFGWALGLRWEARVLLWYKEGNAGSIWRWLPAHLLKFRAGEILDRRFGWISVRAAASVVMEFLCVVVHLRRWDAQYRPVNADYDVRRLEAAKETKC